MGMGNSPTGRVYGGLVPTNAEGIKATCTG